MSIIVLICLQDICFKVVPIIWIGYLYIHMQLYRVGNSSGCMPFKKTQQLPLFFIFAFPICSFLFHTWFHFSWCCSSTSESLTNAPPSAERYRGVCGTCFASEILLRRYPTPCYLSALLSHSLGIPSSSPFLSPPSLLLFLVFILRTLDIPGSCCALSFPDKNFSDVTRVFNSSPPLLSPFLSPSFPVSLHPLLSTPFFSFLSDRPPHYQLICK